MEKWEQTEVALANWEQLCSHIEQFQGLLSPVSSPVTIPFIKNLQCHVKGTWDCLTDVMYIVNYKNLWFF